MSERADKEVEEALPPQSPFKQFQLPLMIGGAVLGLIVFMLLGILIGTAKNKIERNKFAAQTVAQKKQLETVDSERNLYMVKSEGLLKEIQLKKDRITELEKQLETIAHNEQLAASAAQAKASAVATAATKVTTAPEVIKSKEYVRFGNVDCTLTTGKGSKAWDCLKQSQAAGMAEKPKEAAAPVKVEPKPEPVKPAAAKPADPHAKAAH